MTVRGGGSTLQVSLPIKNTFFYDRPTSLPRQRPQSANYKSESASKSFCIIGGMLSYCSLIIWICPNAFLEFLNQFVLPSGNNKCKRPLVNQNRAPFSRKKLNNLFIIQFYLQEPEEDLSLDLLVPDYSQQVLLTSKTESSKLSPQ